MLKVFKTGKTDIPSKPVLYEHLGLASIPYTQSGIVKSIKGLEEIRKMPSYFSEEILVKPMNRIEPSLNLDMIFCGVWLRAETHTQLVEGLNKVHELFQIEVQEDTQDKDKKSK